MLREDNLVTGFAVGVMLPVLVYLALDALFDGFEAIGIVNEYGAPIRFQDRTIALLAICGNLLPFQFHSRLRNISSMRGVLLATGIFVIAWMYFYGLPLFAQD